MNRLGMDKRKVIQITAGQNDDTSIMYALCDDDSIWQFFWDVDRDMSRRGIWKRLPDIPETYVEPIKRRSNTGRIDE